MSAPSAYRVVERNVGSVPVEFVHFSEGDGRPLILLNGISCPPTKWGELPEHLGGTVISIGMPGPDHIPRRPTMHDYARIVADAIEQETGGEPCDLLGFSWGGLLAQWLPGRTAVRKLILAATLPLTPWMAAGRSTREAERIVRSLDRSEGSVAELYGGDIARNPALAARLGLERMIDRDHHERQLSAADSAWTAALGNTTLAMFGRWPNTLVMAGNEDPLIPYYWSVAFGSMALGARLETIDNDGHGFLFTRSEQSAAIINNFREHQAPLPER